VVRVNRTDRLYALVEELRAVAPRPRSARWLAGRFEVSVRTVERDISALQQSGVPVWAEPGRSGGYCLDRERTLPPVNFTPGEAMALAVALRHLAGTPFGQDGAAALRKVLASMRKGDAEAARDLAARVYLVGAADPPPAPAVITDALATRRVLRIGSCHVSLLACRGTVPATSTLADRGDNPLSVFPGGVQPAGNTGRDGGEPSRSARTAGKGGQWPRAVSTILTTTMIIAIAR
jgi:hypothetical protein